MRLTVLWVALAALLAGCSTPRSGGSNATAPPEPYVRLGNADSNLVQLQIAVRQFQPIRGRGPTVWLAGVSHIGDPAYYRALQGHLDAQTLVLYEGISDGGGVSANLVEPPLLGTAVQMTTAAGRERGTSLQDSMAAALGLVFQLDAINYRRSNFRNSDLSVNQLRGLLADAPAPPGRGESGASQGFETLLQAMNGGSFFDTILNWGLRMLGTSPKFQALGRLALIDTIVQIKGDPAQVRGLPPEMNQLLDVLVKKRNDKVLGDLAAELRRLKPAHSVTLFYGTGHMPDLEGRLRAELRYRPTRDLWLTAFAVDLQKSGVTESERQFVRALIRQGLDLPERPADAPPAGKKKI